MTKKILTLILFFPIFSFAQDTCNDFPVVNCNQFEENYIPTNLNEAISYVECLWGKEDLEKIKSYDSQNETIQLYVRKKIFCLEQRLQLRDVSTRLSHYFFNKLTDLMPSDIESIIYTSLQRKLNGEEINLNEQLEKFKEYYRKMHEQANTKYLERREREFGKFKVGDIVEFTYKHYFLKRPDDCKVQAFVNEIDTAEFMLKLETTENCENKEFQIVHSKIYQKENEKFQLQSEEILNLTPNGEVIWTPYFYWKKVK